MKNFLTEKLLLDTRHGSDCTLEVCTAGDPDKDTVILKGSCGDCLRKIASHELAFTGDEYFCLYTNQGSYDGIDLETICYRMGYSPESIYEMLGLNDSPELSIRSFENNVLVSDKKPDLSDIIQRAEAVATHNSVLQDKERNGDVRER